MRSLEQMLAAVVADSARRTYALFGQCRCGFCADDGAVLPNEGEAFGQCQRDRLGVPPPPLAGGGLGRGWHARVLLHTPSLSLPRLRGRERTECAARDWP